MASSMVHIRVNGQVKDEAAQALATMGLTVSDAVRMLLTRVAVEKVEFIQSLTVRGGYLQKSFLKSIVCVVSTVSFLFRQVCPFRPQSWSIGQNGAKS